MKRITGFMAALFLVLGIVGASFAQQDGTMKQTDTMMSSKKPMMKVAVIKTTVKTNKIL